MTSAPIPTPETNITEEGEPGDLGSAAQDEFGGSDEGREPAKPGPARAAELAALSLGGQIAPAVADQTGGAAAVLAAGDPGARTPEQANGSGAD